MTETTDRPVVAFATREGDPEMIVAAVNDGGCFDADDVITTRPLLVDPDTGEFTENLDDVLRSMGYRRAEDWTPTHDGGNATVESW